MTNVLRVGIVGAGYIAGIHSAAYRVIPGTFPAAPREIELTAVADPDEARVEGLVTAWGWKRAVAEWTAITRADDIDLVDICVPNAMHAEVAIDALRHGKHVVCEKPLAHDVESAAAMCTAASSARRLAQVCFYYRTWPAVAWARNLVASSGIGDVKHFRGWMLQDYALTQHDLGWRAERSKAGGGAIADLGSHIIDIATHLCGEIESVCATTRTTVDRARGDVEDLASILVQFAGGASGTLEASWALRGHRCDLGFDLVGTSGAIRFSWERANEIQVLVRDGEEPGGFERILLGPGHPGAERFLGVPGQGMGYRDAFAIGLGAMATAIAQGSEGVAPGFGDGLRAAKIVAASIQSAQHSSWTQVR